MRPCLWKIKKKLPNQKTGATEIPGCPPLQSFLLSLKDIWWGWEKSSCYTTDSTWSQWGGSEAVQTHVSFCLEEWERAHIQQAGQVHRVDSVFDLETKSVLMIPSFWHSVQVPKSGLCPANVLLSAFLVSPWCNWTDTYPGRWQAICSVHTMQTCFYWKISPVGNTLFHEGLLGFHSSAIVGKWS